MDVLGLLDSKKKFLRRFLEVSEQFLAQSETGDFTAIGEFESQRETVINALGMFDRKITETVRGMSSDQKTTDLSVSVQAQLDDAAYLIQSILKTDNRIMASIEREKDRLQKELTSSAKSKEIAGKFKS